MRHPTALALFAVLATQAAGAQSAQPPVKAPVRRPTTTRPTTPAKPAPKSAAAATTSDSTKPAAAPAAPSPYRWVHVTYLSGESIYLDGGTTQGLQEKSAVQIVRKDSVVATVEVQYVSSTRAAGKARAGSAAIVVGDSGRFLPSFAVASAPTGDTAARAAGSQTTSSTSILAPVSTPKRRGPRTMNARLGVRYLTMQNGTSASGRITQPAFDVRLEGHRIGQSAFGLLVDARAHQQRSGSGLVDNSTRVYQSAIEYQTAGTSPSRVTMGRQLSKVLSPVGFFDGVSMDFDNAHWKYGAIAGTQPDQVKFMPAADIREAGAYLQWHNAPGTRGMYQATVGGVGSYGVDGVNREFLLLNTLIVNPIISIYATQEVDLNRGWKLTAEKNKPLTWSSTFATARVSVTRGLSLNAGYDSRRNVRLYRDFITPDVAFDDALRRGYFGGASVSLPHFYANADTRVSDGTTVGKSTSNTASMTVSRLTPLGISLRARGTQYNGPTVSGQLYSGSFELSPRGLFRLEASAGQRTDTRGAVDFGATKSTWIGVDADAGIGRSWYLMGSFYREHGQVDRVLQEYVGLSWRY
ncbi:MAG: hypothetical protein K2R93_02340 [Gemmatimonadaceae bacterium]|nr:hypothetical protein [Gemmatimonadaceae bacterium]